jgi:hypothetical protein
MMNLLPFLLFLVPVTAFAPARITPFPLTQTFMAPKYDKATQRWSPTSPDDEPSAGYNIFGSLLRQGPSPVIQRIFKADDYEQAVWKFMAGDKCDRNTAQGNMDAYLRNPNDWAYNRMKGYDIDYGVINQKDVVLVSTWSAFVVAVVGRVAYSIQAHENFWAFMMTDK